MSGAKTRHRSFGFAAIYRILGGLKDIPANSDLDVERSDSQDQRNSPDDPKAKDATAGDAGGRKGTSIV